MTALLPAAVPSPARPRLPARTLWLAGLGMLLAQLSWILVVPTFAGIDEFAHVYRASGVANGQWQIEPSTGSLGTGAWVLAESDLVIAGRAECEALDYTSDNDCVGSDLGDGTTRVASSAGRYNPLFYALVGYPALPFEGHAAVYAMRTASAFLCTGLFVAGLFALRRIARTPWAWVGAAAAITPVVSYSSAVAAPNGAEIMAGFAFWCGLLALLRDPRQAAPFLLALVSISGAMLVTFRSMGPVWCLLIAAGSLLATPDGVAAIRALLRQPRVQLAAGLVVAATLASVWWVRSSSALLLMTAGAADPLPFWEKVSEVAWQLPLWILQGIAAFPYRNEMAPLPVYAAYVVFTVMLLVIALRTASRRTLLALGAVFTLSLLVPAVLAYRTMELYGAAWQGRYGLPFTIGIFLVAGLGISRRTRLHHLPVLVGIVPMACLALSVHGVLAQKVASTPSAGSWWAPPALLVVALALAGGALLWSVVAASSSSPSVDRPPREH